jgi:two-component system nitrogen regulation response regulator NtrX
MSSARILVVDDEADIRELVRDILSEEGHTVEAAANAAEARAACARQAPDLVLLDIWMPDTDGITLLREWATSGQLTMPVVMMSGHGTIDTAVEATRIGAVGFLEKPIALQKLLSTVGQALRTPPPVSQPALDMAYLGKAAIIAELRERLETIKNLRTPVLLTGEPGCGKSLCARFLHVSNTPWLEPESFAVLDDAANNLVGQAAEGTLFLHGIGDLTPTQQRNLWLQISKLERYHTRLISSSSKPLARLVAEGMFDARLFSAISPIQLRVPSLREHLEDVPELAKLILERSIEAKAVPARQFTTAALNALRGYDWPGNLAELENVVRSTALLGASNEIGVPEVNGALSRLEQPLGRALGALPLDQELREARDAFERLYFEYHIGRENGNMSRVADRVGLERTHLYRKLKQLGVKLPRKE